MEKNINIKENKTTLNVYSSIGFVWKKTINTYLRLDLRNKSDDY